MGLRHEREVPAYQVDEFASRGARYCVCVFVLNENGRLHSLLARTAGHVSDLDVVVADGGSIDGSTARERLRSLGVNTLLVKTGVGRLGAQMRMAFDWALNRGYKGVITIDGNNKDNPAALPRFVACLDEGFDHVQGSRFRHGGVSRNLPMSRWLGLKLIHVPAVRLAAGFPYTDTTNGFRAYSRRLLEDPDLLLFREVFAGYELHYYLAVRAPRLGMRVCEVPVERSYPDDAPAPTKITPLRGNLGVLRALTAVCLGRYDP